MVKHKHPGSLARDRQIRAVGEGRMVRATPRRTRIGVVFVFVIALFPHVTTPGATGNAERMATHHVPEVDGRFNSSIDSFAVPAYEDHTDFRGTVLFTDTGFYFGGSCVETDEGTTTTSTCQITYEQDRLELTLGHCKRWVWNHASKDNSVRLIIDAERREAFVNVRRPSRATHLCNTNWAITLRGGYLRLSVEP